MTLAFCVPTRYKESYESDKGSGPSHPLQAHNNQPAVMEYDDDDYLDSLRRGRHLPSRGNPPGVSNYDLAEEGKVGGARVFATTAPEFVSDIVTRNRTRTSSGDTQGSRF